MCNTCTCKWHVPPPRFRVGQAVRILEIVEGEGYDLTGEVLGFSWGITDYPAFATGLEDRDEWEYSIRLEPPYGTSEVFEGDLVSVNG